MTVRVKTELTAVDRTRAAFNSVQSNLGKMRGLVAGVSAALGAVQFGRFTSSAIESADEINKLSDRLGVSTEALSEYQFVAERTGVAFKNVTDGFQKLGRRVEEASRGQGAAKDTLRELGIEAEAIKDLELDQQFEIVADAIAGLDSETAQLLATQKLFDSENVKLIQTFKDGSAGIRELRDRAGELGKTLGAETANSASTAVDAMADLGAATDALGISLVDALAEPVTDVVNWFTDSIPIAVAATGSAFDELQVFIADAGSAITGALAEAERDLASVAEFFGFDKLASAFEGAAESYEKSEKTFKGVSDRLKEDLTSVAETGSEGVQRQISFQDIFNEKLAEQARAEAGIAATRKASQTDEEKAEERRLTSIDQFLTQLERQADTLGLTNQELVEYELTTLRASDATKQLAADLQEQVDDFEAIREAEEENARIFEESEKARVKEIEDVAKANQEFQDSVAQGFTDAISSADSFGDVLDNLKQKLIELAAQAIVSQIGGGAGGAGGLGGLLTEFLPKFAGGGRPPVGRPFIVGDAGPEVMQLGQAGSVAPMSQVTFAAGSIVVQGGGNQSAASASQLAAAFGDQVSQALRRNR